ncbi:hypothetical protein [Priestia flexa]|uniref:Uncharacterized protein n=1 Tax=Priestia flexa TaxID=86664 RepID=A0A8I1MEM5_9BACI|nr:hypothetical protein [Priestia flexa]MBN8251775.1 hypothetical protein [Priestia flexa]UZW64848.1 hypothetical protein OC195_11055 [Priestia flexa]
MSLYVSSSNIVVIPQIAISHWKAYGVGTIKGAKVTGKQCEQLMLRFAEKVMTPFQMVSYQESFVVIFDDEQSKEHFELIANMLQADGYKFHYYLLFDDHESEVLKGMEPFLKVGEFNVPVVQLDQTGEFDFHSNGNSVEIVIDDDVDEEGISSFIQTFRLNEGHYFIGDPGFLKNQEMLQEQYFTGGDYHLIYQYNNQWLKKIIIQPRVVVKNSI